MSPTVLGANAGFARHIRNALRENSLRKWLIFYVTYLLLAYLYT